ncbi:MAG: transcription-repair coupling factor [Bryobacteraceae bacterium]|nr:transcription-repair coupling factor [Bryobacteraceae bacterium]
MILDRLLENPGIAAAIERLRSGESLSLAGLTTAAKALTLAILARETARPLVVVTDGNKQAEELLDPLAVFGDPLLLPALDVLPHQGLSPHTDILERRAAALMRLERGTASVVVAPIASALLKTRDAGFYRRLALTLKLGEEAPLDDVVAHLRQVGYERREPVEMPGEFSVRGGIVDVFPPEAERPVRIEFFGDTIESMRRFDIATQRSVETVREAFLPPLYEEPGGRFFEPDPSRTGSLFDLDPRALVVWDEPEPIRAAADRFAKRLEENLDLAEANYWRLGELESHVSGRQALALRELTLESGDGIEIGSRPVAAYQGAIERATADIRAFVRQGGGVTFFAPAPGELDRLRELFGDQGATFELGAIGRGVEFAKPKLAVYSFDDLFDTSAVVVRQPKVQSNLKAFAADVGDLKPGDFVVHAIHGVGKFLGIRELAQGDQSGDFLLLEYAGEAKLYVPLTRLDLIQKFRGAGDAAPPLDRMGGATWERTKKRVKTKMRDMADELLKLYAERKMAEGFAYSPDSNWQREFEDSFEYTPTKDQLDAVRDIKRDMESPQPMDRLLCGDVGFGKTEVAMRAAFKALGDGRQVAVLAPTTVLAFQHYETFKRRFAAFPARIELLSRFRSAKEIKEALADLAAGKVDVVIGTHRLFSKDVEFRDLGLMIVDEEQRFGVKHKERLKQIRRNVDALAMSATPIPRTLHMSLLGLRDMSVIETPPKDRLAIHTVVARFDMNVVKAAIEQEVSRGGQVYFVHNRIDSIFMRAASLQELMPQVRIGVGHGQMGEAALEKVLLGFMRHEFDVFVCTTIVENGLDIPLANTMIIENAQNYGLSELYQLRGRVGRSNRRAYAYLLVPPDTELTEIARKRLAALKEFSDLGAGFKIAALDLELRGAGNILGGEQHGHIADVGFDMYVRMLDETVRELRGEEVPPEVHSTLNLGLDIRIPNSYIADEHQRLRAYKRAADLKSREEAESLLAEFADRYGPPPDALRTLAEFALVKSQAEKLGIESIDRRGGAVNVKFHQESKIDPARLMDLVRTAPGAQFTPAGVLRVPLGVDVLGDVGRLLAGLA